MSMVEQAQSPKRGLRAKLVEEYRSLVRLHLAQGPFLEIMHGPKENAISLSPFLSDHERHVIKKGGESGDFQGAAFHQGDSNNMTDLFDDECFSTVIWDRALKHDPLFWLTLAEIKRVLKPSGTLIVCTHGYSNNNKFGIKVAGANGNAIAFLTATASVSASSADYWRVSPQCMRKVILDGYDVREVRMSFMVPHLFGVGVKPT